MINHINKQALETPDVPELVPYLPGTVRGKKWNPPPQPMTKQEEEIRLDMGDEYEQALSNAGVDELVDLAGENLSPFQPWTMDTKIINYLEFHGKILVSKERS